MKKIWNMLSSVQVSELIALLIFLPILGLLADLPSVSIGVTVAAPRPPDITVLTVHPNLKAISITGETIYNTEPMWLEDQSIGKAIELTTDQFGHFVAPLDRVSGFTRVGLHRVIALMEIKQTDVTVLESEVLSYSVDDNFNVTLDPSSRGRTTLLIADITPDEFLALRDTYRFRLLDERSYYLYKDSLWRIKQVEVWWAVFVWTMYLAMGVLTVYLLITRWLRFKFSHRSFWTLGRGIYIEHRHP